jgi:hypothetical protein
MAAAGTPWRGTAIVVGLLLAGADGGRARSKVLIIVAGSNRGGAPTWEALHTQLLRPLGADLMAVLPAPWIDAIRAVSPWSGRESDRAARRLLYEAARILVPVPEFSDWGDALDLMEASLRAKRCAADGAGGELGPTPLCGPRRASWRQRFARQLCPSVGSMGGVDPAKGWCRVVAPDRLERLQRENAERRAAIRRQVLADRASRAGSERQPRGRARARHAIVEQASPPRHPHSGSGAIVSAYRWYSHVALERADPPDGRGGVVRTGAGGLGAEYDWFVWMRTDTYVLCAVPDFDWARPRPTDAVVLAQCSTRGRLKPCYSGGTYDRFLVSSRAAMPAMLSPLERWMAGELPLRGDPEYLLSLSLNASNVTRRFVRHSAFLAVHAADGGNGDRSSWGFCSLDDRAALAPLDGTRLCPKYADTYLRALRTCKPDLERRAAERQARNARAGARARRSCEAVALGTLLLGMVATALRRTRRAMDGHQLIGGAGLSVSEQDFHSIAEEEQDDDTAVRR